MSADRHATRAVEVWRRHSPTGRDMSGRSFWTQMTLETATFVAGVVFMLLQMPLEPALWWSQPPWRGSPELWRRITLGFIALTPVSGVLLERYLARRVPPRTALRPWLHLAFGILGAIPLVGFFLIPLVRHWMNGASSWALRRVDARLDLDATPGPLPRSSRWLWAYVSGASGIWLTITSVLLPFAGCLWLVSIGDRELIFVACLSIHLAQAGCLALYAQSDLRFERLSRRRLWLVSILCLFPFPVSFLAMASVLWTGAEASHQKTLVWSAYAKTGSVRRHSRWLDLRLVLRQSWQTGSWPERWTRPRGLELPQYDGRAEAARRTWMRAKALLLPLEASFVIGWLVALHGSKPDPSYNPITDPALHPWLMLTSLLAALGLLQAAIGSLARLLRLRSPMSLGPPETGLYLFITQAGLIFALLAGPLAAHGKFRDLALVTVLSAALAAIFFIWLKMLGLLVFQSSSSTATLATWPVFLLLLTMPPFALALRPGLAPVAIILASLIPMVDVLIGVKALPWLLYPFRPTDVLERGIAAGTRIRLILMMLVALLPLGGILLPVCSRGLTPAASRCGSPTAASGAPDSGPPSPEGAAAGPR